MNKAELIDVLTKKLDTDRRTATEAVENVVDTIVRAVHKGESVTITGFGVFEQRRRAARVARNPRTGETVKVKPTSVPAFRPGAQFKAVVSGAQRLPAEGPAVKRGSGTGGARKAAKKSAAKKAVKRSPAKKATKRTAAKKTTAKRAPAAKKATKRTAAKKTTAKRAPAAKKATKRTAAKKTTAKRAPAAKKATKRTAAKKTAKRSPAKKAVRRSPAKKGRR
jgi:DNA-binding protein HU-beta